MKVLRELFFLLYIFFIFVELVNTMPRAELEKARRKGIPLKVRKPQGINLDKERAHSIQIDDKIKFLACTAIVNNSLKNNTSKIYNLLKISGKTRDQTLEIIIFTCNRKISSELARKIVTPEEIWKPFPEDSEYDKIIYYRVLPKPNIPHYVRNDSFFKIDFLTKHIVIIGFFSGAIMLILLFLYLKNRNRVSHEKKN